MAEIVVAIVIVIAMITVMGVAMEYNSRRLKFSTFGKNFRPVGVATMDYGSMGRKLFGRHPEVS